MKISYSVLIGTVLADPYHRCLDEKDIPFGNGRTKPGKIDNGKITCKGGVCEVTCNDAYHFYGGHRKTKCKKMGKKFGWTTKLAECKTCGELKIDETDIKKTCFLRNWGGTNKKFCKLQCPGNMKTAPAIKPINKKKTFAVCRCVTWPKDQADSDGKCHWRIGNKIIDDKSFPDDYMENLYCSERKKPKEETKNVVDKIEVSVDHPTYRIPPNLICQNNGDRIVGGVDAIAHSWPWIINLTFGGYVCGGTIIDDTTVLTAAHCCDGFQNRVRHVKGTIGDHRYDKIDAGEQEFKATRVVTHPDYSRRTIANDICVVKFPTMDLNYRKTAARACLPPAGWTPPDGQRCWSAGWGIMSNGKPADVLQEVDLEIISDEKCEKTKNSGYLVEGAMMCAGWLEGGKDGCQGDSGGPLICANDQNHPIIAGITSWGFGCGTKNSPGVWTKVSSYIPWIQSLMDKESKF